MKIILIGLLFSSIGIFAQEKQTPKPESKIESGFDGMIGVSYGSKTLGINVGGPSLKYKFTKNFKMGIGAVPSLIVMDSKAMPRLAVSPIIEYKRWMFITPYYGYDAKNKQIWTFGIGYKLTNINF
ncbi:MAG: hypothetical protein PSV16_12910 [Flavobacterium sp.]|nr:hypothetical protein [Flavobacterium sp.]